MNEMERAALRWLLGREQAPGPGEPPSPGRAALIEILRADGSIDRDLLNALANALEPIGSSAMKLSLELQHRSRGRPHARRPPRRQPNEIGKIIEQQDAAKVESKVEDAAKKARVSTRTAFSARAAKTKARAVDNS